ncbi:phage tail assembly protein [Lysobacter sp. CA199]|uniref:phage tail assembly protein n=1 Tax=Lysobacter sp. CA199 TaxID=3455608 RepID=UPI003F8D2077
MTAALTTSGTTAVQSDATISTTPAAPTGPNKLPLKFPFTTAGGVQISALNLRRPKVRDLKQSQRDGGTQGDQEVALFALIAGLTPEDMDEMDAADYTTLQARFQQMQSGSIL